MGSDPFPSGSDLGWPQEPGLEHLLFVLVVVGRADLYAGSLGDLGEVTRLDYRDLLDG